MKLTQAQWFKYKYDFLRMNHCTEEQFAQAFVNFMDEHHDMPNERAYRVFARRWNIRVIHDPMMPKNAQVVICVTVAMIKVLSKTEQEARQRVEALLSDLSTRGL